MILLEVVFEVVDGVDVDATLAGVELDDSAGVELAEELVNGIIVVEDEGKGDIVGVIVGVDICVDGLGIV